MDARAEIEAILNSEENDGAVLLTGPWGCGKSYLIKDIAKHINEKPEYKNKFAIAVISLFGIDSVEMLNQRIRNEYLRLNAEILGEKGQKATRAVVEGAKKMAEYAKEMLPDSTKVALVNAAIQSIGTNNFLNLIPVESTIQNGGITQKVVLVFDDFERCKISLVDLMGVINEYSENRKIKTLIIANEEEISGEKYGIIKEKLISHTIKLSPNFEYAIHQIIIAYSQTEDGYSDFIKENEKVIRRAFIDSGYGNLRVLKSCIWDFERVYGAWNKTEINVIGLRELLYHFSAVVYEHKKGKFGFIPKSGYQLIVSVNKKEGKEEKEEKEKRERKEKEEKEEIINKYLPDTFTTIRKWDSLCRWIVDGDWDEEAFIEELEKRYKRADLSYEEKFIYYNFWDLEDEDIKVGMPIAVGKAYTGELTRDELIMLLQHIHALHYRSMVMPCEVSYQDIQNGFDLRKQRIKNGEIRGDRRSRYSELNELDEEAKSLYKEIEYMDYQLVAWENRRKFISYLNEEIEVYDLRDEYLESFDSELEEEFMKCYRNSRNSKKRELCWALRDIGFDCDIYSNDKNMEETITNFRALQKDVQEMPEHLNDQMVRAINNSFITLLKKKIEKLEEKLESMKTGLISVSSEQEEILEGAEGL